MADPDMQALIDEICARADDLIWQLSDQGVPMQLALSGVHAATITMAAQFFGPQFAVDMLNRAAARLSGPDEAERQMLTLATHTVAGRA